MSYPTGSDRIRKENVRIRMIVVNSMIISYTFLFADNNIKMKRHRALNENDTNVKNLQYNIVIRFKGKYNCVERK